MKYTISPDVIVTWPSNCDYPLWRRFIFENRLRFNKVIVVFHHTNALPDFRDFVMDAMKYDRITFLTDIRTQPDHDWRDDAINAALSQSDADWVWFTEQDFTLKYPIQFWMAVDELDAKGSDAIGILDGSRLHPCCLFISRLMLGKLQLDFGTSDRWDHFGRIQNQLYSIADVGILDASLYHHMNGLSHNLRLMFDKQEVTYKPDEFIEYLKASVAPGIPVSAQYLEYVLYYIKKIEKSL